jgi:predicted phosphodiesterase
MNLGWLSDIHLNFLDAPFRRQFVENLSARSVDAWLLSGDVGDAPSVVDYLQELATGLSVPLYFVLGNHDFYRGSIREVTKEVRRVCRSSDRLVWLSQVGPQFLAPNLALVGDDGWGDGRLGDPFGTPVELNDFLLIEELAGHTRPELVRRLNRLGDESAARLGPKLEEAATACTNLVVVTHVPPFEGASWHEGRTSSHDWLPWFSCDAVGRAILGVAERHPATSFLVLCGHTHSPGQYSPVPAVVVHTAGALYGSPVVQRLVELDGPHITLSV